MVRSVLSVVTLAVFAGSASAGVITATYVGQGAGSNQLVAYSPSASWNTTPSGPFYSVKAREHQFTTADGSYTTWCIQLYQGLGIGMTYNFAEVDAQNAPTAPPSPGPMGSVRAEIAADAFARWTNLDGSILAGIDATETNNRAAAFAALLWELTHENFTATTREGIVGQMSLSMGALRANLTAGAVAWYNQMYASLGSGGWITSDIIGWVNSTAQDQLVRVPAPGAVALLGLAGLAVGRGRRRA